MPMRDNRRGLRATIFADGAMLSPAFERDDEPAETVEEHSERDATFLGRLWQRLAAIFGRNRVSKQAVDVSFDTILAAELGSHVEDPLPRDDAIADPAPTLPCAFEISLGGFAASERIVPITRRRLRPRQTATSYDDRLQMLRDALRTGSDAERALAIEGLSRHGLRDELPIALEDPLEPLAAKAALAFAGTTNREQLAAAIKPHITEGRLAAILALLPGLDG